MEASRDKSHGREAQLAAGQVAQKALMDYLHVLSETETLVQIDRLREDLAALRQEIRGHSWE